MHFTFGSPYLLVLFILLPCFLWCKQYSKTYYFPKIEWITRQSPLLSWEPWLKMFLFTLMVLALDASGSMAQSGFDVKDRFKNKFETNIALASAFIKRRLDDNMGIVIFGTFAYTASPLTYDLDALRYLLSMTNIGIAGESTAIGDAIMQSIRTLSFGEAKNRAIILLTDGYHNAGATSPKMATEKAKALGIKVYTIGIGKKSNYDVALLETIAKETGAKSYAASSAEALNSIYKEIETLEPSHIRSENYLNQKLLILFPLSLVFILLLSWTLWKERSKL